ncbi:hypothetical protein ACFX2I_032302 [Malus domestica]
MTFWVALTSLVAGHDQQFFQLGVPGCDEGDDQEGDMILVGDVPWHMFVSTVKRLHFFNQNPFQSEGNLSNCKLRNTMKNESLRDGCSIFFLCK